MTGKDVKKLREKLGLNQTDFGVALGYANAQIAISKIENRKTPINKRLEKMLRMMEKRFLSENVQ